MKTSKLVKFLRKGLIPFEVFIAVFIVFPPVAVWFATAFFLGLEKVMLPDISQTSSDNTPRTT